MKRVGGLLLVVAVGALAVVATVDGLVSLGGDSAQPEPRERARALRGAELPAEGALAGRLFYVEEPTCRLRALDLHALSLAGGTRRGCAAAISPDGRWAVVGSYPAGPAATPIGLVSLADPEASLRPLGLATGDATWSPDGRRVAWCVDGRSTAILDLESGARSRVPGCNPRFASTGALVTVEDGPGERGVLVDGTVVLFEADLARSFGARPGRVHPIAADQRADGLLAVAVATAPRQVEEALARLDDLPDQAAPVEPRGPRSGASAPSGGAAGGPRAELQLWRGRSLVASRPLRPLAHPLGNWRFGELLRFSPTGTELAVGYHGAGAPLVVLDVQRLRPALGPTIQRGFAWSPDGAYFALATGIDVRISGALRSDPAYVLPVRAANLGWRE